MEMKLLSKLMVVVMAVSCCVFTPMGASAELYDTLWPYYYGFEGTDGVAITRPTTSSPNDSQNGWRAYNSATSPNLLATDGYAKFSTAAQAPGSTGTGAMLYREAIPGTANTNIYFERAAYGMGTSDNNAPVFDYKKSYLVSFMAKKSGAGNAKFALMQTYGTERYLININSENWQKYYFYVNQDAFWTTTSTPPPVNYLSTTGFGFRFTLSAGEVTLCVDDFSVEEANFNTTPGSRELFSDGGFDIPTPAEWYPQCGVSSGTTFYNGTLEFASQDISIAGNVLKTSEAAAHSGVYGLEVARTNGGNARISTIAVHSDQFEKGKVYRISFWANATVAGSTVQMINNFDNKYISLAVGPMHYSVLWGLDDSSSPMRKYLDFYYSNTVTTPQDMVLRIVPVANSTVYFDDFSIQEVSVPNVSIVYDVNSITATGLNTTVLVKNNDTTEARNGVRIVGALYDNNKELVNVVTSNAIDLAQDVGSAVSACAPIDAANTNAASVPINFALSEDIRGKGYTFSLFAIGSFDNVKPLTDRQILSVDKLTALKPVVTP